MTDSLPALVDLLSEDRYVRRDALDAAPDGPATRYALRAVLLLDRDGTLRALAAERLGATRDPAAGPWLRDAAGDPLPAVREAAYRGVALVGDRDALGLVRRASREEPVWWARRSAVRALAVLGGFDAIDALRAVLDDPFWRVRHTAVLALAALGDAATDTRAEILARAPGMGITATAALDFLSARWTHEGVAPPKFASAERADEALWNADPAVITARLEALPAGAVDPRYLVELLGDAHAPLRALAARRLAASGDGPALVTALRWLDEPRIPHAADTTQDVLAVLGVLARPLATRVLAGAVEPVGAGAVAWALGWTAAHAADELFPAVRARVAHPEVRIRRAATAALAALDDTDETLTAALDDPDDDVRALAAANLLRAATPASRRALAGVSYARASSAVRTTLLAAAARDGDVARLREAATDAHPWRRAAALGELSRQGELSVTAQTLAARDPDPWVRAAVLESAIAPAVLADDPDPEVRRAALAHVLAHVGTYTPAEAAAVAATASRAGDPWLRARACRLLTPEDTAPALATLLALSRDTDPMVRAAAADRLERCAGLDTHLQRLLADRSPAGPAPDVRAAAYTWLLRAYDSHAFSALTTAVGDATEPAAVQAHLRAVALAFPAELLATAPPGLCAAPSPRVRRSGALTRARVEPLAGIVRRPLGRTGLAVAPLALSGVADLAPEAYAHARDAGVNAFFWEPRYANLTRWVRRARSQRDDLVLIAGTFYADARSIERDVETALRRLRTDRIDVFLLFWVRSPERLSSEAFDCLARLKHQGKIRAAGFSTHHRDLARAALEARAWDVVMTRHNAAHTGAETALFPAAEAQGTGVLTFSALCYGRMLQPAARHPGGFVPDAPDCYRYSLTQPGVTAVIAAPRRFRELAQNLPVLAAPTLAPEAVAALRAHGARVHAQSQNFNALIRQVRAQPVGAPAAVLDLLAAPDLDAASTGDGYASPARTAVPGASQGKLPRWTE